MQNPKQSRNGKQRTKSKVCTEQEEWREEPGQQYQRSQWQGCVTYSIWNGCVKGNSSKSFPEPNPLSHQPHKACGKLPDNPGGDIVPSLDSKWKVQSAGRPGTPQVCCQPGPHVRKVQAWSSQTEKDPLHCEHMAHGGGGAVLTTQKASEDEHFKAIREEQRKQPGRKGNDTMHTGPKWQWKHICTCRLTVTVHMCTHVHIHHSLMNINIIRTQDR